MFLTVDKDLLDLSNRESFSNLMYRICQFVQTFRFAFVCFQYFHKHGIQKMGLSIKLNGLKDDVIISSLNVK